MKKLFFIIMLVVLIQVKVHAQVELVFGVPSSIELVKKPFVYIDALRNQEQGWDSYYRSSENAPFVANNMITSKKNADGFYTLLHYQEFDAGQKKWFDVSKFNYRYETDEDNNITKIESDEYTNFGSENTRKIWQLFNYKEDKLINYSRNFFKQATNSYEKASEVKFIYNLDNQRVIDSMFYYPSSEYNYVVSNTFNNNNKCVGRYYIKQTNYIPDTFIMMKYDYQNNNLTKIREYHKINDELVNSDIITYHYDNQNRIIHTEIINHSHFDNSTVKFNYYQGFNSNNKLTYLSSNYWHSDNEITNLIDSVILNYSSNGIIDTSYVFIPDNNNQFELYPNLKFVFKTEPTAGLPTKVLNAKKISVFPNPTNSQIQLDIPIKNNAYFKVLSIAGETVLTGNLTNNIIDVSGLNNGIYVVTVTNNNQQYLSRFVKTN